MAVIYTILQPLPVLTGFTVTPIAGTQATGTYDFMAVATTSGGSFRYYAYPESPPIYVYGVVLNGTQGVRFDITFDGAHPNGTTVYFFARKSPTTEWVNGTTSGMCLNGGSYTNIAIIKPATSLSMASFTYSRYAFPVAALDMTSQPYALNNQKGMAVIQLHGAWSTTSNHIKTIFDAIKSGSLIDSQLYFYNGFNHFAGFVGIECINTLTGTVDMGHVNMWLMAIDTGFKVTDGRNYTIKSLSTAAKITQDGTIIATPRSGGWAQFMTLYNCDFIGAVLTEGSYGLSLDTYGGVQASFINCKFKGCKIHIGNMTLSTVDLLQGSILYCGGLIVNVNSATYISPFTMYAISLRIDYNYSQQRFRELNFVCMNNSNAYCIDIRVNYTPSAVHSFLDCTWNKTDSALNIIETLDHPWSAIWYYVQSHGYPLYLYIEHTFSATIKDNFGNALSGVTVKIYDKNGLKHTLTSDVNGLVSQIIRTREITWKNNPANGQSGTNYIDIIDLFPFTITMEKTGYETETYNTPTITTKLNWTIVLNETATTIASIVITDCTAVGSSDGQVQVNAESGVAPYEYSINGTDWQVGDTFTGLAAGTYSVYVRDANLKQVSMAGVKISTPVFAPRIDSIDMINPTTDTSVNGSIIVNATIGTLPFEYSLDGITFQSSNRFDGLTEGFFTVYLRDGNSGSDTATVTLIAQTKIIYTMVETLKTLLADAGCTFIVYENEQMVNTTIEPAKSTDIIGVVIEPSRVTFKTGANGIGETFPTVLVEILKQVDPEDTAENNITKLDETRAVAAAFINAVIGSGEFKRLPDVEGIKINERRYDANVIGWSLAMPLFPIINKLNC
jgi:hypothetical protein